MKIRMIRMGRMKILSRPFGQDVKETNQFIKDRVVNLPKIIIQKTYITKESESELRVCSVLQLCIPGPRRFPFFKI